MAADRAALEPLPLRWEDGGVDLVTPGSALALIGAGAAPILARACPPGPGIVWLLGDSARPLHPGERVGTQIAAALGGTRRAAWDRAIDLLEFTGMPEPQRRVAARPHRLGALDRQRAQLALILANGPHVLLAHDPTAGLDPGEAVTFAATLRRLWQRLGFTLLLADSPTEVSERVAEEILVLEGGVPVQRRRRAPQPSGASGGPSSSSSST